MIGQLWLFVDNLPLARFFMLLAPTSSFILHDIHPADCLHYHLSDYSSHLGNISQPVLSNVTPAIGPFFFALLTSVPCNVSRISICSNKQGS